MVLGPLMAATAIVAGVVIALWTLTASEPRPEPRRATSAGPRVIATVPVAGSMNGSGVVAFGAVWVADAGRGEIVRIDPATRRVTDRIPIDAGANIDAGSGAVWAVRNESGSDRTELLRIDPGTRRVAAHIPLRTRAGTFTGSGVVAGPRIWALGPNGAVRVDPVTERVGPRIDIAAGFTLRGALVRRGELWLTDGSGATIRYDARTGRRLRRVAWNDGQALLPAGNDLVRVGRNLVSRVDPATGRAAWRRRVGYEVLQAGVVGDRVLVIGTDGVNPREVLWELDVRTGRPASRPLVMRQFGAAGIVAVGGDAWVLTNGGRAVVLRP
jgi:outer membrane protein assembly factor BamB